MHMNMYILYTISLVKMVFLLIFHENIHASCGYSLEVPHQGASNEYQKHMFSWKNKKSIYLKPPLICSYEFILRNLPAVCSWSMHMNVYRYVVELLLV